MKKAIVVIVASVVILGLIIGGCAQPAPAPTPTPTPPPEVIKWKVQSWAGATYQSRLMIESAMDKLKASGRFEFDYLPGEMLMTAKEAFDGLREGVLNMAITSGGYHIDRMGAVGEIEWMPLNFEYEKFVAHYRDPGGFFDFSQPAWAKMGLRLLAYQKTTPGNLLSTTRPVRTLEDMKGLMHRDPGAYAEWLKLLGAVPISISSAELYEGFQRGVVEGHTGSLSSYMSQKWYEVAPYVSKIDWIAGGMSIAMNLDDYNGLPADARALLDQAILEADAEGFEIGRQQATELFKEGEAVGVTFIDMSPQEMARWEAAIQPYFDNLGAKYGAEWTELMKIRATLK